MLAEKKKEKKRQRADKKVNSHRLNKKEFGSTDQKKGGEKGPDSLVNGKEKKTGAASTMNRREDIILLH